MGELERIPARTDGDFHRAWQETEAERVETWRLHELLAAGYPVPIAEHLAKDFDVDLHRAVEIIAAGCPFALAEEILT